jgi:hypothetical protein
MVFSPWTSRFTAKKSRKYLLTPKFGSDENALKPDFEKKSQDTFKSANQIARSASTITSPRE